MELRSRLPTGCILLVLVLFLCSCAFSRHADPLAVEPEPAIAAAIDSPLLDLARGMEGPPDGLDRLALLEIGEEALLARIHLIRAARESVKIQTIIWVNDEVGRLMITS